MYGKGQSALTAIEAEISEGADFDLAAGYPNFETPNWLRAALDHGHRENLSLLRRSGMTSGKAASALSEQTILAALQFLGQPLHYAGNTFVTSTGSLALERSITAMGIGRTALTLDPEIDLIPALVRESFGVEPEVFADVSGLLARARAWTGAIAPFAVFSEPNNPTGRMLTTAEAVEIASLCQTQKLLVLLDGCFSKIARPDLRQSELSKRLPDEGLWILLWDTGKTFGLNHEKLAFVICSPAMASIVRTKLQVLQYDIPARTLIQFARVLQKAAVKRYADWMWSRVETNGLVLRKRLGSWFDITGTSATSFALLRPKRFLGGVDISELRVELLRAAKVGLLDSSVFFTADEGNRDPFLRCALARRPSYFRTAISRLRDVMRSAYPLTELDMRGEDREGLYATG